MNILKWSERQSLFRFKSLISLSVGYASLLYERDCMSEAIIFAAVLTRCLVSSSPFSCLFRNQTSFAMELALFPKQTTSSLPFTSAKNIALLYFFFGRFLNHFTRFQATQQPSGAILTLRIVQLQLLTTRKGFQRFCLLCY